jgi:glycosyltransferase involved in cell wall biosynthesis
MLAQFAELAPTVGVTLTVGYLHSERDGAALRRMRRVGVDPVLVPTSSLLGRRDIGRVRAHIASVRPDVVHTPLKYADVLGGIAARSLGVPVVSTLHEAAWGGTLADRAKQRVAALVRRHCAARVIAVSDAARRSYLSTGWDRPERVVRIYNGVVIDDAAGWRDGSRRRTDVDSRDLVVAMVSALRPEKAHEHAFAALDLLLPRFPNLRLLVVGDGPRRPELDRMAARFGRRAVMVGFQEDVAGILAGVDVLLHPSYVDAFPTALLEAMAVSVPVVATAVGGIPEIVTDGVTGVLVAPPPHPARISDALAELLGDQQRRRVLGEQGRRRFESDFSAAAWVQQTRGVYDGVVRLP